MKREVFLNGYINNDRGQKKGDSNDDTTIRRDVSRTQDQLRPPTAPKVDPPISRRFLKHEFTFDSVPTLVTRHDSDSSDDEYESDSVGSMPSLVDREEFDSSDDESDDGGIIVGDGADHVYLFGNRIDYGSRRQQIVDRGANGGLRDNSELHMENIAPIHGDVAYEQAASPEETAWAATWRSAFSAELDESIRRQDAPYETLLCSSGDHGKRTTGGHTIHPAMQPRDEGNRSDKVVGDQGYSTHDAHILQRCFFSEPGIHANMRRLCETIMVLAEQKINIATEVAATNLLEPCVITWDGESFGDECFELNGNDAVAQNRESGDDECNDSTHEENREDEPLRTCLRPAVNNMCAQTCINDSATTTPFCPSYKALVPVLSSCLPHYTPLFGWLLQHPSYLNRFWV